MDECEITLLPTDQCAHCTGSKDLVEEPWYEQWEPEHATKTEQLMEREAPDEEIQRSLKEQGTHWRFWAKKGIHTFAPRPSDLEDEQ